MPITVVSRWTGKKEDVLRNAGRAKPIVLRLGAEDYQVAQITTGREAGQWIIVVRYRDWPSYAQTAQAMARDEEYQRMLAEGLLTTVLQERNMYVGCDV